MHHHHHHRPLDRGSEDDDDVDLLSSVQQTETEDEVDVVAEILEDTHLLDEQRCCHQ